MLSVSNTHGLMEASFFIGILFHIKYDYVYVQSLPAGCTYVVLLALVRVRADPASYRPTRLQEINNSYRACKRGLSSGQPRNSLKKTNSQLRILREVMYTYTPRETTRLHRRKPVICLLSSGRFV